ncbi:Phospholipase/carboxylesterase/thioesterase [Whalleya microplaca]|nr:Phospholipase/carboxylesterase/thioesterase [Whalleya microplaca]
MATLSSGIVSQWDTLVIPAPGDHKATIIFAHGLGENGSTWKPIANLFHIDGRFHDVKVVLPTAAPRNVTLWNKDGKILNAWYDIPSWNDITAKNNDEPGMEEARNFFSILIDQEIANGIPASNIFLGGFSQGGCIALFAGITGCHSLGGVFALSAYLPMIERVKEITLERVDGNTSRSVPFFLANGNGDPQVKWNWGLRTYEAMKQMGLKVEFRTYRGLFHFLCAREFDDLKDWISDMRRCVNHETRGVIVETGGDKSISSMPSNILAT